MKRQPRQPNTTGYNYRHVWLNGKKLAGGDTIVDVKEVVGRGLSCINNVVGEGQSDGKGVRVSQSVGEVMR